MKNKIFLRNRVRELREKLGFTQKVFADLVNVSEPTVRAWESGKTKIPEKHFKIITANLRTNIQYLLGNTDDPAEFFIEYEPRLQSPEKTGYHLKPGFVPVVSWAKAGAAEDFSDLANQIDEQIPSVSKDPNAFALIIEGNSMEPTYPAGLRVIFEPNSMPRNGFPAVARLNNDHGVMFKIYREFNSGTEIELSSINPEFKPIRYKRTDFRFIYPAVEYHGFIRW